MPVTVVRGNRLHMWCPGCDGLHTIRFEGHEPWTWDGNVEAPTISPSIRASYGDGTVCHSFVRDGVWEFLGDSYHDLAGEKVPMVPLPDWMEHDEGGT